jgi:phospholipase C
MDPAAALTTKTPIKHLVVVIGAAASFDHYFGTYPNAQNNAGETLFTPAAGTPSTNNLSTPMDPTNGFAPATGVDLLNNNPNLTNAANGAGASNPFRLSPFQAATQDMGHNYKPEQEAFDNNAMDLFPRYCGTASPPPGFPPSQPANTSSVMAYFDGNTVTALWNFAQGYSLNDNAWTSTFGPETPGVINLVSGQTNGFGNTNKPPSLMAASHVVADGNGDYSLIGNADPLGDVCSTASDQVTMSGKNIGDLLNAANVTWGFFQGGFDLLLFDSNGTTGCHRSTNPTVANYPYGSVDYVPHSNPFQYYPSTSNLTHARPSSIGAIGSSLELDGKTPDPANHQYDTNDFFSAVNAGLLPAVSFVAAPAYQNGHPGYSDPVDEQVFLASVLDSLIQSPDWNTTAVVLVWASSDGWYDHQGPPIVNASASAADLLNGAGVCNTGVQQTGAAPATPLLGAAGMPAQGRCGYGTRIPLLVISPFAKINFVDHTLVDQSSVLRFIEDNWLSGQRIQPGGSFDTVAATLENMFTFH